MEKHKNIIKILPHPIPSFLGCSILTVIFILSYSFSSISENNIVTTIDFYSEKLSISYNPDIIIDQPVIPGEQYPTSKNTSIQFFYEKFEHADYQSLIIELRQIKKHLLLNDWFYYELIRSAINKIYENLPDIHKRLGIWAILSKEGYDARITYIDGQVFLNVFTDEELFEVPMIREDNKTFVNLTSFHCEEGAQETLYISSFTPNPYGKAFSFDIQKWPKLPTQERKKLIEFEDFQSRYTFTVNFDKTVIELMSNYPVLADHKYVNIPFSESLSNSILPVLKDIIEGKSIKESLEILAAFTRKAFDYKTDEEVYGKSKPMISEELFHYRFSDCEDRSTLFFNLVKKLLDIPMVVIAYSDHVTVGVHSNYSIGQYVWHNGRKFYICDPTGPEDSFEIGKIPLGYANKEYEIIATHR